MKFGIALESMMGYNTYLDVNNEPGVTGVEALVADNLFEIESSEYRATVESMSVDVDIMLSRNDVYTFGTEADEDKKEESKTDDSKKAWYKKVWDAIVKMFKTIGGWFSSAWKWIKKKFGKGGSNDVSEKAKKVVDAQADAAEKVAKKVESGEITSKEEAKAVAKEEVKKEEAVTEELANTIAENIADCVENVGGSLKVNYRNFKVVFYLHSFEALKRFDSAEASRRLSKLESYSSNTSSISDDRGVYTAAKNLMSQIIYSYGYYMYVMYGRDYKEADRISEKLANFDSLKTSDAMSSSTISELNSDIRSFRSNHMLTSSSDIKTPLSMHEMKVSADSSTRVNRQFMLNEVNKSGYSKFFKTSSELSSYIVKLSDIMIKSTDFINNGLNKFNSFKEYNAPADTNYGQRAKAIKETLTELNNICKLFIDGIKKADIDKIKYDIHVSRG